MATDTDPETLALELSLFDIDLRLRILDQIIKDGQAEGDERWKTTAAVQAEILNEARGILLKRQRKEVGIDDGVFCITPRKGIFQIL